MLNTIYRERKNWFTGNRLLYLHPKGITSNTTGQTKRLNPNSCHHFYRGIFLCSQTETVPVILRITLRYIGFRFMCLKCVFVCIQMYVCGGFLFFRHLLSLLLFFLSLYRIASIIFFSSHSSSTSTTHHHIICTTYVYSCSTPCMHWINSMVLYVCGVLFFMFWFWRFFHLRADNNNISSRNSSSRATAPTRTSSSRTYGIYTGIPSPYSMISYICVYAYPFVRS